MVTHDPEISQQAQRILYMKDGMIEREEKKGA
jgi:ABC-type lipoprotein export system ATPase subunit